MNEYMKILHNCQAGVQPGFTKLGAGNVEMCTVAPVLAPVWFVCGQVVYDNWQ